MDTLKKAELTVLMCYIERCLKSRIPIYNSEVPDTAGKKNNEKKNTGNCKAFCISRKYEKAETGNCKALCFSSKRNKRKRWFVSF